MIISHTSVTSRFVQPRNSWKFSSFVNGESPFGIKSCKIRMTRRRGHLHSTASVVALMTDSNFFEVGRLIGSYGFMNISRIYEGRVIKGRLKGMDVQFKVYPGRIAGGMESDLLAANELVSHNTLQEHPRNISENIQLLLGAFETNTGEQWLAFRNDGRFSAADYAKFASENISKSLSNNFPIFGVGQKWKEKRYFVIKLLNGAMNGLAHMHKNDRLHQSLGPASVVMNTILEKDAAVLVPRLRDLAFSVDVRYTAIGDGPLSQDLWRRAISAGAIAPFEKRAFAIADDIRYAAGLLFAYLAFVPFCEAGVIDAISLQRLLESTFRLDLSSMREYCLADDRLAEAVKFLDLGGGSGWELLQAMLNPDYKKRPIAEAVLNHRFITGAIL
ncbi:protein kinase superfamily protein isoform X4 [Carex rostrata]